MGSRMMVRQWVRWAAVAVVLGAVVGCSDRRGDLVREFVAGNPPENASLVEVTGEFPLEAIGDGRFRTSVPVRYRTRREMVTIFDGFGVESAGALAARLDAVRDWAAGRLPEGAALRTSIERTWQQARYGFLLKRVEHSAGSELPALVTLELRPTVEGGWVIEESGNTLELTGETVVRPEIPVVGTEAAGRALAEVGVVVAGLEALRADWEAAFARRAAEAEAALRERLATGLAYPGTLGGEAVRMVISRGVDRDAEVMAVVTTSGTPRAAARFVGGVSPTEDGGAVWRGRRVEVISGGAGELDGVERMELRVEGEGLAGSGVRFSRGEVVDLIPEI